jgi:HAD superfamily hydrolase (TIGR01549 family)
MATERVKAVLFDIGETLLNFGKVDTMRLFGQGARSTYDFLIQQQQPVARFWLYYLQNFISLRWHYLLSNIIGKDFNGLALLQRINERHGVHLSSQQWQELSWLWYEPLGRAAHIEPDIPSILTRLRDQGLKLGILSNTFVHSNTLERHFEQLGWLEFFPVRLYSYEFAFRKPDERIFREGARRIGEDLEHILYVGDRINKDIRPALRLGMPAVLKRAYTNAGRSIPREAWVIERLVELPGVIEKINASQQPA